MGDGESWEHEDEIKIYNGLFVIQALTLDSKV